MAAADAALDTTMKVFELMAERWQAAMSTYAPRISSGRR